VIIVSILSGLSGGLLSWGINHALFGFRVTHPHYYLFIITGLTMLIGWSAVGYQLIQERLEKTAARLAEKEVAEQRLKELKVKAELSSLRARVNPHFLFNTLNSIASLIPVDPGKAEEMVQMLSALFRHALDSGSRDLVSLSEEIATVKAYLEIEKVRLGKRLDYSIDLDGGLEKMVLPGMLLQPLVENGIKHGIGPLKEGGRIHVRCSREDGRCKIEVADTGRGMAGEPAGDGFGLASVKERLALQYGDDHAFEIGGGDGGTRVTIVLPFNEGGVR
jgi:LytS/YehU family sensor histidine kinase